MVEEPTRDELLSRIRELEATIAQERLVGALGQNGPPRAADRAPGNPIVRLAAEVGERFVALLAMVPVGITISDPTTDSFVDVNPAWLEMVGYARKTDVLGKTPLELGVIRDPAAYHRLSDELRSNGRVRHAQATYFNRSGDEREVLHSLDMITVAGRPYILMSHMDISQRILDQDTIRRGDERFRVATSHGAFAVAQTDGLLRYIWSRSSHPSLAEDRVLGLTDLELESTPGSRRLTELKKRVLARGVMERETIDFSGSVDARLDDVIVEPLHTAAGEICGVTTSSRDVTEVAAREDALRELRVRAQEQEAALELKQRQLHAQRLESLGRLAGGVAHEINNVLMAVLGLSSLLEAEMPAGDPKRYDVEGIVAAAKRGRSVIEGLLGFARLGRYSLATICLNDLVRNVERTLRPAMSADIAVDLTLAPDLRSSVGDELQISQALTNIILNASDAIDGAGTITVSTANCTLTEAEHEELGAGRFVVIHIDDNGRGMDEATLNRATTPFFTTKEVGKGTGLGLSMAWGVVQNHNGAMRIESTPGVGTCVSLWLPEAPLVVLEDITQPEQGPGRAARQLSARVLLVDDEEMVRTTGGRMLRSMGCDVMLASSSAAALDIYQSEAEKIDIVLLDLTMPVANGLQCFNQLQALDPAVRVLICTGHGSHDDAREMLRKGALGVVRKPFSMSELARALSEHVELHPK